MKKAVEKNRVRNSMKAITTAREAAQWVTRTRYKVYTIATSRDDSSVLILYVRLTRSATT